MRILKAVMAALVISGQLLSSAWAAEEGLSLDERVRRLEERLDGNGGLGGRFHLGGYGEIHGNFESGGEDKVDFHRLVFYVGYDFSEWIRFNSEIELEHAFVSGESDGEVSLEQGYVDFLLSPGFNVRIGRFLTPLGIVNQRHEPPSFNGVERPLFAKYIIPTTWSSDGVGLFGHVGQVLRYQLYMAGGLDGSGFDPVKGIRGGRINERPSLNDPAVMGRVDLFPLEVAGLAGRHLLRAGVGAYASGLDNGNGGEDPGKDGDIFIVSADFEYTFSRLDLKGVWALERIDGSDVTQDGAGEEILGWYLEGAYRWFPDSWKRGRLSRSDSTVFVRYEALDTQREVREGVEEDPAGERSVWTAGVGFYPVPNLVLKADYQVVDYASSRAADEYRWNVGIGWQF